ncbi:hypothetical protein WICMUC_001541 [Wickerhamomyces mucosus]|uniref:Peptidase M20 dimerisation domain-containing protein n=1 Tax=Wickerhamomyces mucosus TaxID=1378264 RepID=A0A9P8PWG3_9ASCO|nr:hypothetical protein WICMUC_001541 [Wickerhamomyces mucosus]
MRLSLLLLPTALGASIPNFFRELIPQELLSTNEVGKSFSSSEHELIKLHKSLVEIESVSGNEYEVSHYLSRYLTSKGFNVELETVEKNRENVYAYLGESKDAKILLTSHIDTVPGLYPYYLNGETIYGRGSNDAKASVASQVIAALELIETLNVKAGEIALLYVVGEEYDGIGMKTVSTDLDAHWDHVIFGEPTELKLGVGHKGVYHFDISIKGKASHSGYPQLGIDANQKLIDTLHKISHADFPTDELLGITTVNNGLIEGGDASNIVSPHADAKILIRVAKDTASVRQTIRNIIAEENKQYHNIEIEDLQFKEPVYLDYDVPGFETTILAYFTDIPNLTKDDIKSRYLYGPGSITNAHTPDEHITLGDLKKGVEGYKDLVTYLLDK